MTIADFRLCRALIFASTLLCCVLSMAACGEVERAVMRGAERSAARTARAAASSVRRAVVGDFERAIEREAERDARIVPRTLMKDRTVFRYTTRDRAMRELERGLSPGTHMTSHGGAGRPLSAEGARSKYGLSRTPEVRETIKLRGGESVRIGKAINGKPGVGEITSPDYVKPRAISRVVPVK